MKKHPFLKILILLFTIGLIQPTSIYAQSPGLGTTSAMMSRANTAMEKGEYTKANAIFREIIESNQPIPAEMPYLFAKTLYALGQYHNSQSFVNKYLDLNGFKGSYYKQAKALQNQLVNPLAEIVSCQYCDARGYRYGTCETCHGEGKTEQACSLCKGRGIIGCSRCAGDGLVTKKNVFNILEYFECERCSGKGRLTCTACQGTLVEVDTCPVCEGSGHILTEELCDHTAPEK